MSALDLMDEIDKEDTKREDKKKIAQDWLEAQKNKIFETLDIKERTAQDLMDEEDEKVAKKQEIKDYIVKTYGKPSKTGTVVSKFGEGLTGNFLDELVAKTYPIAPEFMKTDWEKDLLNDKTYEERLEILRAIDELESEESPALSTTGEITGGITGFATGGGAVKAGAGGIKELAKKIPTLKKFAQSTGPKIKSLSEKIPQILKSKWFKGVPASGTATGIYTTGASEDKEVLDFLKGFAVGGVSDPVFRAGFGLIKGIGLGGFASLPAPARESIKKKWKELGNIWKDEGTSDIAKLQKQMMDAVEEAVGERGAKSKKSYEIIKDKVFPTEMVRKAKEEAKSKFLKNVENPRIEKATDRMLAEVLPRSTQPGVLRIEGPKIKKAIQTLDDTLDYTKRIKGTDLKALAMDLRKNLDAILKEGDLGSPEYKAIMKEISEMQGKLGNLGKIPDLKNPLEKEAAVKTFIQQVMRDRGAKKEALKQFSPKIAEDVEEAALRQFIKSDIGRGSTGVNLGEAVAESMSPRSGGLGAALGLMRDKYGRRVGAQVMQAKGAQEALFKKTSDVFGLLDYIGKKISKNPEAYGKYAKEWDALYDQAGKQDLPGFIGAVTAFIGEDPVLQDLYTDYMEPRIEKALD